MKNKKRRFVKSLLSVAFLLIVSLLGTFVLSSCDNIDFDSILNDIFADEEGKDSLYDEVPVASGNLNIHFIDVGQADCTLLMTENANMLIDTGDLDDTYTEKIISYLKAQGVNKLDYLVLTHPDSDHIGGAPEIINEFEVVNCILPDFAKTTKIYENTLEALEDNEVNVIEGKSGESFGFGDTLCNMLAPVGAMNTSNNSSVVIKLTHGENTFMFVGDAEEESEEKILETYNASDLKSDFLKAGHHGSSTSSTVEFLDAVSPTYAYIPCGKDNKYGHPHNETIDKFEDRGIEYYRADINGTLIVVSDGSKLTLTPEKP